MRKPTTLNDLYPKTPKNAFGISDGIMFFLAWLFYCMFIMAAGLGALMIAAALDRT